MITHTRTVQQKYAHAHTNITHTYTYTYTHITHTHITHITHKLALQRYGTVLHVNSTYINLRLGADTTENLASYYNRSRVTSFLTEQV